MTPPRVVPVDGSPESVEELADALRAAFAGGPTVFPTASAPAVPLADASERVAVVIATSGSTGEAKLVALSAAALRASALATQARLGGPARWLLALPAEHVAGVQVVVRALLAGAPPVVQDLRTGFRPDAFADATTALGPGRRCTSLVPTQLARILDAGGAPLDALRSYAAVLVGGAALDAELGERARAAGVAVVTTYGMSETAGGCVYDGVPLDGVQVDLDGGGRIRLGGPTLADGYLGDPAQTAAAFADGWFRTGDLGRFSDGRLEVLGRADDMIITGGENVAPAAVERVLVAQPGVRAACVVGLPDAEWGEVVAATVVLDGPPDSDRLRSAVRTALGRAAVPRVLLPIAEIPLRGIGKPDRAAVARTLSAHAGMGTVRACPRGAP
ncbi:o-succinylbenzoate--CoA ligase [Pseudonocardia aurantiaca]|uniref:O-succinylbenzoate--CoA ligase n=1 Tax=Pseudonocardia aurantiaca TaxID=75290 RepID=A0ABW4FV78_9PSEU